MISVDPPAGREPTTGYSVPGPARRLVSPLANALGAAGMAVGRGVDVSVGADVEVGSGVLVGTGEAVSVGAGMGVAVDADAVAIAVAGSVTSTVAA